MDEFDLSGIGELELSGWDELWRSVGEAETGSTGIGELITSLASGGVSIDGAGLLEKLGNAALGMFRESFSSFAALIAVAVAAAVIGVISRDKEGLGSASGFLCFGMSAALAAYNLAALVRLAYSAADELSRLMEAATPVLAATLAATGSTGTGALMSPLTAFLNLSVTGAFKGIIMPVAAAAGVAAIIGVLSGENNMKELFGFLKSAAKWITGAVFTVYFGVVSIEGMTVARADTIAVRTARYTLDKSVPIVGGAVSGTLDTLLASATVIKNAAGTAAVVTAFVIAATPLMKIACSSLACKAVAALCEPLGESRIAGLLSRLSEVCSLLFACLTAATVMFMITAGLVIAAGNP